MYLTTLPDRTALADGACRRLLAHRRGTTCIRNRCLELKWRCSPCGTAVLRWNGGVQSGRSDAYSSPSAKRFWLWRVSLSVPINFELTKYCPVQKYTTCNACLKCHHLPTSRSPPLDLLSTLGPPHMENASDAPATDTSIFKVKVSYTSSWILNWWLYQQWEIGTVNFGYKDIEYNNTLDITRLWIQHKCLATVTPPHKYYQLRIQWQFRYKNIFLVLSGVSLYSMFTVDTTPHTYYQLRIQWQFRYKNAFLVLGCVMQWRIQDSSKEGALTWLWWRLTSRKGGLGVIPQKNLKVYIKIPSFWVLLRVLEASEGGGTCPLCPPSESTTVVIFDVYCRHKTVFTHK